MINNDLINYIQSQKALGVNNESIKSQLLSNAWSEADIDQALEQKSEKKVKIIKVIAVLLFLIAGMYAINAIKPLGVIFILQKTFLSSSVVDPFLKFERILCAMSLISAISSMIFFYVGFRITDRSKFSFFLIIISLIFVNFIYFLLNFISLNQINGEILNILPKDSLNIENFALMANNQYQILSIIDPLLLILILTTLVLTIISFKKFNLAKKKIAPKFKVILIILAIIFTVPNAYFISSSFIRAGDTDFAYSEVQAQVNYHVYKPTPMPTNLVNATKFYIDEDEWASKKNVVRIAYDFLKNTTSNNGQSKTIILRQVGVEANFDLFNFNQSTHQNLENEFTLEEVSLAMALDQTAYFFQRPFGESTIRSITFLSSDYVLIEISSLNASFDELVEFASSLK